MRNRNSQANRSLPSKKWSGKKGGELTCSATQSAFALVVDAQSETSLLDDFFRQYGYQEFDVASLAEKLTKKLVGKSYRLIDPALLDKELLRYEWLSFVKPIDAPSPSLTVLKVSQCHGRDVEVNQTLSVSS